MLKGGGRMNIWDGDAHSVRVAVRARPLSAREKVDDATECVQTMDSEQIKLGSRYFTFDAVYDDQSRQEQIYDDCVSELVKSCLAGYNATILAYGQTGSGKTFTMGSTSVGAVLEEEQGIIPRAIRQIFDEMTEKQHQNDTLNFKLHVSFLEIYNEEIKDLLDTQPRVNGKNKQLHLREGPHGSIQVLGVNEEQVSSYEDMLQCLEKGTICRSVGSTSMNAVSSRSHAIFTVSIEQNFDPRSVVDSGAENVDPNAAEDGSVAEPEDGACSASIVSKFHFVDLAGSERVKRTQAAGDRLKEGININYGLLVLGNVISALGDESRKGSHVPYRDSKLTRMLQDSIGGNSRTLMIACVSPADSNFAESYNTLVYANRARNIKNKPVVNRDPREAELARMREQVARLQAERDAALKHAGVSAADLSGLVSAASASSSGREAALVAELKTSREDNVKLLGRLEAAEAALRDAAKQQEALREEAGVAMASRDGFRHRLEEALGRACPEEAGGGGEEGEGEVRVVEEQRREIEALKRRLEEEERRYKELGERYQRKEKELEQDQNIFSAKNKKIEDLAKQNNALKAEKIRMSMSPAMARTSSFAPGDARPDGRRDGGGAEGGSPSALSEHRRRLEGALREGEEKEGEGEEAWQLEDSGEEEDEREVEPGQTEGVDAVDAKLAEEEERTWRQGLLQKEVEVRDLSTAIDSKEKLLEQLMRSQAEVELMKHKFEAKMAAAAEAVKSAEEDAHRAKEAVGRVKSKDEQEMARLVREHAQKDKEYNSKMAGWRKLERDYKQWMRQRDTDQQKIRSLQDEIAAHKQSKAAAVRKMKEDADKYREWRERHHREVQQLKRTAQKAEYQLRKYERDIARLKAVLKRREEEKAAAQRQTREMALANARVAKTEKVGTAGAAGGGHGAGAHEGGHAGRPPASSGMKTRSQVAERVDKYKMNRAKVKLKNMIEEYGQRGKLQAELARLKADSKAALAEVKALRARRDKLQLARERSMLEGEGEAAAAPKVNAAGMPVLEAWGDRGGGRGGGGGSRAGSAEAGSGGEEEEAVELLSERLEEKETRIDYNRERTQEVERTLRALPDFDGAAGVWADDETVEVPAAYEAIRDANGAEAKFLLRFLFKRAALFREAERRVCAQAELQRVAIEEQRRERDQAVGALRRAELSFEHRCAQLQASHEQKCLLLYSKVNLVAADDAPGGSPRALLAGSASPSSSSSSAVSRTPGGSASPQLDRSSGVMATPKEEVRMKNEEIQMLRAHCEQLRGDNKQLREQVMQQGGKERQGPGAEEGVPVVQQADTGPSECVVGMSNRINKLKSVIHGTKSDLGSISGSGSAGAAGAAGGAQGTPPVEFEFREGDTDPTRLPFHTPARDAQQPALPPPAAAQSPGRGAAGRGSSSSEDALEREGTPDEEAGGKEGREGKAEETPAAKQGKVTVFDRLAGKNSRVAQAKYRQLLKVKNKMVVRPYFMDWHDAVAEARLHPERTPQHLHAAAGEADKENFVKPTPRQPASALRRSQDEGEEVDADAAVTPGVNRQNVFTRLQDPKSYTGIHKQSVDALLSNSEWKGGAPQSAGKAAQHSSGFKTPRQPRFTSDTPVRGGGGHS